MEINQIYAQYCEFWTDFKVANKYRNRRASAFEQWKKRTDVERAVMLHEIKTKGAPDDANPYFWIQDFVVPEPEFLHGDEAQDVVQVRYNGGFRLCSRETQRLYNLEYVSDWNPVHPDDR